MAGQDEAIACSQLDGWRDLLPCLDQEVFCAWNEDNRGWASFRPRTVALDFSGALGGVSFAPGAAGPAADPHACSSWQGGVELVRSAGAPKSSFRQALEHAAQQPPADDGAAEEQQAALEAAALLLQEQHASHWTDLLQVDLHPSTALVLPGVWQGSGAWCDWGPAPEGSGVLGTLDAASDRVRWWAEQCDALQGLQVLAADTAGWGSAAVQLVTRLREDFPSQPLWYLSLQEAAGEAQPQQQQQERQQQRACARHALACALGAAELPQLASLYVPLAVPPLPDAGAGSADAARYHGGALLAAALDTVTLPLRVTGAPTAAGIAHGGADMHSLTQLLAGPAANLAAASLQLPAPALSPPGSASGAAWADGRCRVGAGAAHETCRLFELSPGLHRGQRPSLAESVVWRGAQCSGMLASTAVALDALEAAQQQRRTAGAGWPPCASHACVVPAPLPLPLSLPCWLGAASGPAESAAPSAAGATAVPLVSRPGVAAPQPAPGAQSSLAARADFAPWLRRLGASLRREGRAPAGQASLLEWGYTAADADELQERLLEQAGRYSCD